MYIFLENNCFQTYRFYKVYSIVPSLVLHANDYLIILSRELTRYFVGVAGWENTTRFSTSIVAKLTTILPEELQPGLDYFSCCLSMAIITFLVIH